MLVYANSFRINLPPSDPSAFWRGVDSWILRKTRKKLRPSQLVNLPIATTADGHSVEVLSAVDNRENGSTLVSVVYGHPDGRVKGRYWVTRIGLRSDPLHKCAQVTVVTETSDSSVQSGLSRVMTSRPGVVLDLIRECGLIDDMVSSQVQSLRLSEVKYFRGELDSASRSYAIILVSPNPYSEKPEVDPVELLELVVGLANVVVIPDKKEAKAIAEAVGRRRAAWDGAINIIYPPQKTGDTPTYILMQAQLRALREEKVSLPQHVLHLLTHRTNLLHYASEITPGHVQQLALDLELEKLEAKGKALELAQTKNLSLREQLEAYASTIKQKDEIIEKLKESMTAKDKDIAKEKEKAEKALNEWMEAEEERSKLKAKNDSLLAAFENSKNPKIAETLPPVQTVAEAVDRATQKYSKELEFALNSKSEHKNSPFQRPQEVLEALDWLATRFLPSKLEGGLGDPDENLRNFLPGWKYSAHQSEATMKASREWYRCPRKGRRGNHIWLEEHIKYGSSRKAEETIRIAFAWEEDSQRIIIGFIGQHQDNTKSN